MTRNMKPKSFGHLLSDHCHDVPKMLKKCTDHELNIFFLTISKEYYGLRDVLKTRFPPGEELHDTVHRWLCDVSFELHLLRCEYDYRGIDCPPLPN